MYLVVKQRYDWPISFHGINNCECLSNLILSELALSKHGIWIEINRDIANLNLIVRVIVTDVWIKMHHDQRDN